MLIGPLGSQLNSLISGKREMTFKETAFSCFDVWKCLFFLNIILVDQHQKFLSWTRSRSHASSHENPEQTKTNARRLRQPANAWSYSVTPPTHLWLKSKISQNILPSDLLSNSLTLAHGTAATNTSTNIYTYSSNHGDASASSGLAGCGGFRGSGT